MMKISKFIRLVLVVCLLAAVLSACGDEPADTDYDTFEQDSSEETGDEDWEEDTSSEQDSTFSVDDIAITEEFADKVHAAMDMYSFKDYKSMDTEQWKVLDEEGKQQAYGVFFSILLDLDFPVNVKEETWIGLMDEDADFYTDQMIWSLAFENLGLTGAEKLVALNNYVEGVKDGKYASLHPDIFAAADDITVEYYQDQYLLCVGGNHNISQMTKKWTVEDSWFTQSGSVTPISTGDIFEDVSLSYSIGGENGKFTEADLGEADLLPVFKAIGAISEDGTMLQEQIQISAKSSFDAPVLVVLTQGDDGIITFAVVKYSKKDEKYVWDGKLLTTAERCCFNQDGNFSYVDENGTLQVIEP